MHILFLQTDSPTSPDDVVLDEEDERAEEDQEDVDEDQAAVLDDLEDEQEQPDEFAGEVGSIVEEL